MKRIALFTSFATLLATVLAAQSQHPATPEGARAFLKEANEQLLKLGNAASRAGWTQSTYITPDTEVMAAEANAALVNAQTALAKEAFRFDKVQVSPSDGGDPEEQRWRLLQAVTSFLRNASLVQPLLLVLEDLRPSVMPTPAGSEGPVSVTSPEATVTFSSVDAAGTTTISPKSLAGLDVELPGQFSVEGALLYDVSTTASFEGPVELCFQWQEGQFANENNLRLLHNEGGSWIDVTTTVDTTANRICGTVGSLSPFVLVEPSYRAAVQQPINANGTSVFKASRGVVPVKFTASFGSYPTCEAVGQALDDLAREALRRLKEEQAGYEGRTDHGYLQCGRFP